MHRNNIRTTVSSLAAAAVLALFPAGAAAAPEGAGCGGLHDVAAYTTYQHGDTPGHQRVHEVFEAHQCGHHD